MAGLLLECSELSAVFMVHQYVSGACTFDPVPECSVARAGFKAGTKNAGAGSYGGHDGSHFTGCSGQTGAGLVDVHLSNNILLHWCIPQKECGDPQTVYGKALRSAADFMVRFYSTELIRKPGAELHMDILGRRMGGHRT